MADSKRPHADILEQRFARTETGEEALLRAGRLPRRHATVLRLLDGRVSGTELAAHLRNFDLPTILGELQAEGLIESFDEAPRRGSLRSRWRLFGRREHPLPDAPESTLEDEAAADADPTEAEAPEADDSTRRLRSYLNADLDDDDITDIMGTERNV